MRSFAQHAPGAVHFLKIDVEGMEQEVLAGLSLRHYRPWILVIEATRPNSPIDVSRVWEPSVLGSGYRLVYRDGLNRFYLAEEQMARAPAFDVPPNVFDEFISYREYAGNEYALSLEARLQALHDSAEELRHDLVVVTDTAIARQKRMEELDAVLAQRQSMLEELRRDLVVVTDTAIARQKRMEELDAVLAQRQSMLEELRGDLAAVTDTAIARQKRMEELDAVLAQRQSMLEEAARTAEAYRVDLIAMAETAERRQQRMGELETSLSKVRQDVNLVAVAAEHRRILIGDLESRLGHREQELGKARYALHTADARLDGLRKELNTVYASYSWRLTVPLRILSRSARRVAGRILRAAAAFPLLRAVGGRILTGGVRQRVLNLAGFEPESRLSASTFLPTDALDTDAGQIEISRAGMRIYRLLAMAHGRGVQDKQ